MEAVGGGACACRMWHASCLAPLQRNTHAKLGRGRDEDGRGKLEEHAEKQPELRFASPTNFPTNFFDTFFCFKTATILKNNLSIKFVREFVREFVEGPCGSPTSTGEKIVLKICRSTLSDNVVT